MGYVLLLIPFILLGTSVWAAERDFPMSVNTASAGDSVSAAPASGMVTRAGKSEITFKIVNSCFPTNLRGVANPLAPSSIIYATLNVVVNGESYDLKAEYPAYLVTQEGMTGTIASMNSSKYSISGGGSAAIYGNTVLLRTKIPTAVSVDDSGSVTKPPIANVYVNTYNFEQKVTNCGGGAVFGEYGYSSYTPTYNCGDYMGKDGVLTASYGGISASADNSNVEIYVSFPGQTGFCGGYWSPLMVFFDEARPRFDNRSDFPLNPGGKTMWPEAGAPGWFVATDRDQSGKIDHKDELFGDNGSVQNGFEALKKLDSNKDGFISKKDRSYKKLVLWQDKNGDGISQKDELIKLSEKVMKISLAYEKGVVRPLGKYAEARERSKFWYKEKGKIKKGDIVDIWLSPAETKLSQR